MSERGDWIQTYTGKRLYPADPQPNDIVILDIAHALSMLCRFGGHCIRFYSVAEHSVLLARAMPNDTLASWALMHDASEAYLADVPRPIKPQLVGYRAIEERLQSVIFERFGLIGNLPPEVKQADSAILMAERVNMAPSDYEWSGLPDPLPVTLQYWTPQQAEQEFLGMYERLWAE